MSDIIVIFAAKYRIYYIFHGKLVRKVSLDLWETV